ncbi:VOC family protein [Halobacillus litoralis]|uniref:VOC family protein n=1 Tax=Halobacillus litoralis TaxID=45668 RepID=UPI001CD659BE|nr:VOC family protein [Halobacillus litoralis]MCA0971153.1 VOC family protein [Halobacillus litoralis]
MFTKVGQVMLYLDHQEEGVKFWTEQLGFVITSEEKNGEMKWFEVTPRDEAETTIVLHDKEVVARLSPGLNLDTPSLMFYSDRFDELYKDLQSKGITVGEIVNMPTGRVFNFADHEENYFAVMEK